MTSSEAYNFFYLNVVNHILMFILHMVKNLVFSRLSLELYKEFSLYSRVTVIPELLQLFSSNISVRMEASLHRRRFSEAGRHYPDRWTIRAIAALPSVSSLSSAVSWRFLVLKRIL